MGNFQKGGGRGGFRSGNRGGDRGSQGDFKKKSWGNERGGDRDRGPLTMHRAICTECGKNCELPFRPIAGKPVLCKECFGGKSDTGRGGNSDFKERSGRRDFNDKSSFSFSKPTQSNDDIKKQISELNTKVDRLIALVEKSMKVKGDTSLKGDPVIIINKEKKTPSLKAVIEDVVVEKAPAKVK